MSPRRREDIALMARIHEIHQRSHQAYGAPMVHAELADDHGIRVDRKRVARLMREGRLRGVTQKRFVTTTVRAEVSATIVDLVKRQFKAEGPDRL